MDTALTLSESRELQPLILGDGNDATEQDDRPDRDIRFGVIIALAFFVLFLGWASVARLDSAAYAPGKLTVSGQRQAVQHRDGGVVSAIFVREGQRVTKGQPLLELAAAEVRAQERAIASQVIDLKAQRARLQAEQLGLSSVEWPTEFAGMQGEDKAAVEAAMRLQTAQFRARSAVLTAQAGVLRQQAARELEGAEGYRRQAVASAEQERLITEELDSLKELAAKGFVSKTRLRALERARAELIGQRGQYRASVAQSAAAANENRLRQLEVEKSFKERSATELRDVEFALSELLPKYNAAKDQLERTRIRAPASGTVVGLSIFTVGGVIAPGQRLMDIVPEKAILIIEAKVAPEDADDLSVGQAAEVRFSSLHERGLPILSGKLTRLSADSFTDEKTGESYYTAEVTVPPSELRIIQDVRGEKFALRAGMPVQVLVPLKKRTALQYAFEPLTQSLWRSFREH
jgi:HlyD family secretion protein